jgi:hypothetical protein
VGRGTEALFNDKGAPPKFLPGAANRGSLVPAGSVGQPALNTNDEG